MIPRRASRSSTVAAIRSVRRATPRLAAWVFAFGLSLGLVSCGHKEPAGQPAKAQPVVVAEVGDRRITADDLLTEAARDARSRRTPPDKEELLRNMVDREILVQRARKDGLDRDPEVRREFENLLIRRLTDRQLEPRREAVQVSDDDVRHEYESNAARYTRAAQVRLAMLFLEADAKLSAARRGEIRARLEEARARAAELPAPNRARGSVGFGTLAISCSDDQVSRHRGGDLGWIEKGQTPTRVPSAVIEAGWQLAQGAVSEVIDTSAGFYVVMKTDSREATTIPLERVAAGLRQSVLAHKRADVEQAFREESRRQIPNRLLPEALASVNLPAPVTRMAQQREPQPPGLPGAKDIAHGK